MPVILQPPATPSARRQPRFSGFWHLLLARVRELKREPEVIFWVFVFPLLLAFGLGIAFRNRPADVPTVAIVQGPSAARVSGLLERSPGKIHSATLERADALNRFRLGKFALVIVPQNDGSVQYVYDPARQESAVALAQVDSVLQSAAGRTDPIATRSVESSEPGARYIDFLIPGLLGMNLMNSGMWGVGFALVEMRQRKLLKRYVATPMRRSEFLMALTCSRLTLMVIEVGLLLGFGIIVFHMRLAGSLFSVILLGVVGAICFAGIGLLTASRAQKIESVSGLINLVMMPMWIFSGVFFSYERFPQAIHPFIRALPLTALNDALRSVILEGAPLYTQGVELVVLCLWGGVSFALALRWFRWT